MAVSALQRELRKEIPTPVLHFYMVDGKLTTWHLSGISSGASNSDTLPAARFLSFLTCRLWGIIQCDWYLCARFILSEMKTVCRETYLNYMVFTLMIKVKISYYSWSINIINVLRNCEYFNIVYLNTMKKYPLKTASVQWPIIQLYIWKYSIC